MNYQWRRVFASVALTALLLYLTGWAVVQTPLMAGHPLLYGTLLNALNQTAGFVFNVVANGLILAIPFAAGYFVARWRYIESKQLKVAAWIVTVATLIWTVVVVLSTKYQPQRAAMLEVVANLLILAILFAAGYFVARWRYIESKQLKVAAWVVTGGTLIWVGVMVLLTIKGSHVRW